MTSEVEICKLALSHIRAGNINSLTEPSPQAQQCALKYPFLRDMLLESESFNFASRIAPLALSTAEVFNWAYVHVYPSDCLKINRLILNWESVQSGGSEVVSRHYDELYPHPDLNQPVKYDVLTLDDDSRVIVANEPELRISYRVKVTDPNRYTTTFVMALSHLLASEIAIPLVGEQAGAKMQKTEFAIYQSYLSSAVANDANEQYEPPADSEFITIRS